MKHPLLLTVFSSPGGPATGKTCKTFPRYFVPAFFVACWTATGIQNISEISCAGVFGDVSFHFRFASRWHPFGQQLRAFCPLSSDRRKAVEGEQETGRRCLEILAEKKGKTEENSAQQGRCFCDLSNNAFSLQAPAQCERTARVEPVARSFPRSPDDRPPPSVRPDRRFRCRARMQAASTAMSHRRISRGAVCGMFAPDRSSGRAIAPAASVSAPSSAAVPRRDGRRARELNPVRA